MPLFSARISEMERVEDSKLSVDAKQWRARIEAMHLRTSSESHQTSLEQLKREIWSDTKSRTVPVGTVDLKVLAERVALAVLQQPGGDRYQIEYDDICEQLKLDPTDRVALESAKRLDSQIQQLADYHEALNQMAELETVLDRVAFSNDDNDDEDSLTLDDICACALPCNCPKCSPVAVDDDDDGKQT